LLICVQSSLSSSPFIYTEYLVDSDYAILSGRDRHQRCPPVYPPGSRTLWVWSLRRAWSRPAPGWSRPSWSCRDPPEPPEIYTPNTWWTTASLICIFRNAEKDLTKCVSELIFNSTVATIQIQYSTFSVKQGAYINVFLGFFPHFLCWITDDLILSVFSLPSCFFWLDSSTNEIFYEFKIFLITCTCFTWFKLQVGILVEKRPLVSIGTRMHESVHADKRRRNLLNAERHELVKNEHFGLCYFTNTFLRKCPFLKHTQKKNPILLTSMRVVEAFYYCF
jgi:hypothetical protein